MSKDKAKQNQQSAETEQEAVEKQAETQAGTAEEAAAAEPADTAPAENPELEKLRKENAELNDRLLRSAAEFDNFRKRTQKEKQEMMGFSKALCIKEILGVVDSFELALNTECKDPEFKKGMEMIFSQMKEAFTKLGVTEIEALNQQFNPELHNAIKQVEDESFGENTVCQVLQKGYKLDDRIIRHSMVVVANP